MADKFRKRAYFKHIIDERNKGTSPFTYIFPETVYELSWNDFFELSELPLGQREFFKEEYRNYYITSNQALIDSLEGKEFNTLEGMKLSYPQMSLLKNKFSRSYEMLLRNLQKKLLKDSYSKYEEVPIKIRGKFENVLFLKADSAVKFYDDFYNDRQD
ncbi:hypothetical protein [Enterococcus faecium]|uniref:hypothetical protein n=1 Tax=Enterococcus faecium TaxID=1352 RepID=UPI001C5A5C66|nr:hypothetical protein [Enterococcus faecium]QXZ56520.1 hypothetical protein KYK17_13080 [Enterococcus faecium]